MTAWMHSSLARRMHAMQRGETAGISLDLGRTTVLVRRVDEGIETPAGIISEETLARIVEFRNVIVKLDASDLTPLQVTMDGRLYKLVCTASAPTVLIAGIQMHRLDDACADAQAKTDRVVRPGDWVLDTCGGLGYTAESALASRAGLVLSTEPNSAVRELRRHNPWSPPETTTGLRVLTIPAESVVEGLPDGSVDTVVHDPPRFPLAGSLYSRSFYASLRRVLRRGGRLYHYTGMPYKERRGMNFVHNTAQRLRSSGFVVSWDEASAGLVGRAH